MVSRLPSLDQRDVNLGQMLLMSSVSFRVKFSLMFVLLQRAEEDAHAFLDKELKKLWKGVTSQITHNAQRVRGMRRRKVVVDGEEEEQRRRAIEVS